MGEIVTIYVALLNEDVEVWRPVLAEHLGGDSYLLIGPTPEGAVYDPDDEEWEFKPGTVVRRERQAFSGNSWGFVARSKVADGHV
jgi:hypothetical protein